MPLIPMPPKGAVRSRTRNALTQVVPARTARPTRSARSAELRADDRREPVGGRVGELDRLRLVVEGLEGQHRAEDLALDDLGIVRGGLDQGRLVEEPADLGPLAAAHDRGRRRRGRARRSPRPGRGARGGSAARSSSPARAGRRARARRPRRRSARGNRSATARSTSSRVPARHTWPRVVVHPRRQRGRVVEVGVGEDEQRALAAELARERHEVRGRGLADRARRSPASR